MYNPFTEQTINHAIHEYQSSAGYPEHTSTEMVESQTVEGQKEPTPSSPIAELQQNQSFMLQSADIFMVEPVPIRNPL